MGMLPSNVDDPRFSDVRGLDGHPELRDAVHSGAPDGFVELVTWAEDHEQLAGAIASLLELLGNVFGELPNVIGQH